MTCEIKQELEGSPYHAALYALASAQELKGHTGLLPTPLMHPPTPSDLSFPLSLLCYFPAKNCSEFAGACVRTGESLELYSRALTLRPESALYSRAVKRAQMALMRGATAGVCSVCVCMRVHVHVNVRVRVRVHGNSNVYTPLTVGSSLQLAGCRCDKRAGAWIWRGQHSVCSCR